MRAPIHQLHGERERWRGLETNHRRVERDEAYGIARNDGAVHVELEIVVGEEVAGGFLAVGVDHDGLQIVLMVGVVAGAVAGVVEGRGVGAFGGHGGDLHLRTVLGSDDAAARRHEPACRARALGGEFSARESLGGDSPGEKRALYRVRVCHARRRRALGVAATCQQRCRQQHRRAATRRGWQCPRNHASVSLGSLFKLYDRLVLFRRLARAAMNSARSADDARVRRQSPRSPSGVRYAPLLAGHAEFETP